MNSDTLDHRRSTRPWLIAVGVLFVGVGVELIAILTLNSGFFVFVLDDSYIQLTLAENIRHGHYGVNADEFAAPSSSILWPLILAPFAALAFDRYVLLVVNVLLATGTLFVFWQILKSIFSTQGGNARANISIAIFLLLLIPATNMIGLIFTGMEHSLQVLCVSLIIWGIIHEMRNGSLRWWVMLAVVIAPLIRYENFAVALPALLYFSFRGYRKASLVAASALVTLIGGFSLFLVQLDLGPLSTSILMKSGVVASGWSGHAIFDNLSRNLANGQGIVLAIGMSYLLYVVLSSRRKSEERLFAGSVASAIALHLLVGRFGWFYRYEVYIWTVAILTILYLNKEMLSQMSMRYGPYRLGTLATFCLLLISMSYVKALVITPLAANNLYEQQYQMHRFAVEYYKNPVAVNDLGYVSYRNNQYVLDLWGLASIEALNSRTGNNTVEWMNRMSKPHDVRFAMIYDDWFDETPDNWHKIGELHLGKKRYATARSTVAFYVLDPRLREEVHALIDDFRQTLPKGVEFTLAK